MRIRIHAGEAWCPKEHDIQYIRECLGPDLGYVCLQTTPVLNAFSVLVPPDWNAAGLEVVKAPIPNYFPEMSEDKVHAWHVFSPATQHSMEPVLYFQKLTDYKNTSTEFTAGITPTMQSYLANRTIATAHHRFHWQSETGYMCWDQRPSSGDVGRRLYRGENVTAMDGKDDLRRRERSDHPLRLQALWTMAAGSYEADRPMDEYWAPLILRFCANCVFVY
ncbi:unnamed protein product [Darwinula stevensoni]|uniref:Uncharacterized protein n=1 Tax=Darwinula stevensoni TaxID=69355 RepID=A0A7R8X3V0_9CRUS|nr:unnamed protein product [Darwinula stevensoni]CAG0884913.1 unnamed protein product [Darwinula stevensoni]